MAFDDFLETNETVAFLIIQNDTIVYENYFKGYEKATVVPSFSMAKSILSILTGCAIDDGLIKSVNEPVTNYLSELEDNGFDKVTIENPLFNIYRKNSGSPWEWNMTQAGALTVRRTEWKRHFAALMPVPGISLK